MHSFPSLRARGNISSLHPIQYPPPMQYCDFQPTTILFPCTFCQPTFQTRNYWWIDNSAKKSYAGNTALNHQRLKGIGERVQHTWTRAQCICHDLAERTLPSDSLCIGSSHKSKHSPLWSLYLVAVLCWMYTGLHEKQCNTDSQDLGTYIPPVLWKKISDWKNALYS